MDNNKLEKEATKFLKKHGFNKNGLKRKSKEESRRRMVVQNSKYKLNKWHND